MPDKYFRPISPDEEFTNYDFTQQTIFVWELFWKAARVDPDQMNATKYELAKSQLSNAIHYFMHDPTKTNPAEVKKTLSNFTKAGRDKQKLKRLFYDLNARAFLLEAGLPMDIPIHDLENLLDERLSPNSVRIIQKHARKALELAEEVWPTEKNKRNNFPSRERDLTEKLAQMWERATGKLPAGPSWNEDKNIREDSTFSTMIKEVVEHLGGSITTETIHAALVDLRKTRP